MPHGRKRGLDMDWSKGYTATYYAERIDPATWRDIAVIELTGGTVKREQTGKRQSADLACMNYHITVEEWVRVYLDAKQNGATVHVPIFTGLATTPADEFNGTYAKNTLTCYSVLKPAEDVLLPRGWYAPAGGNGGAIIRGLLRATPAPTVIADGAPILSDAIIAEDGESNLSMIDKVLDAIGWRLRIEGDGTIYALPLGADPVARFDPVSNDVIEPQVNISADWYSAPNCFMAVNGSACGTARDDDPDSALSTVARGREVWAYESSASFSSNETIAEYAARKLAEAQRVSQTASYNRRYTPAVHPGDIITLNYPEQGLNGNYTVTSQSVTLSHGARTAEQIIKE